MATFPTSADSPPPRWGPHHFGYRANTFMLHLGARFLWLAYALIYLVALYFFVCVPKARRSSLAYLDRLRPGRSPFRRAFDSYRHIVTFGKLLLDRAVMLASDAHGFKFSSQGMENFGALNQHPKGLLLLTAHFGCAEAAAPYLRKRGLSAPINIVMLQQADATERFHTKHRSRLQNVAIINTTDPLAAGIKIIAALNRAEIVGIRADRALAGKTTPVQFLNSAAQFPAGPFVAAGLTQCHVMSVYTVRVGYKKYRFVAHPPRTYSGARQTVVPQAAQDYATDLESIVRAYPLQWGNFYDFWEIRNINVDATAPAAVSAHS